MPTPEEIIQKEMLETRNGRQVHWLYLHPFLPPTFFELSKVEIDKDFSPEEQTLIRNYNSGEDDFGFLISGEAGVGKTFVLHRLCLKVLNDCLDNDVSPAKYIAYYPMGILLNKLRANFEAKDFNSCLDIRFLFLDDLGAEYATEFAKEQLFTILDTRLVNKLPTFLTTNLSLEDIKSKYGERIASRLKELCVILRLKGKDRRNDIFVDRIKKLKSREREA